jgi:hypothetical protein
VEDDLRLFESVTASCGSFSEVAILPGVPCQETGGLSIVEPAVDVGTLTGTLATAGIPTLHGMERRNPGWPRSSGAPGSSRKPPPDQYSWSDERKLNPVSSCAESKKRPPNRTT